MINMIQRKSVNLDGPISPRYKDLAHSIWYATSKTPASRCAIFFWHAGALLEVSKFCNLEFTIYSF